MLSFYKKMQKNESIRPKKNLHILEYPQVFISMAWCVVDEFV
jgi:hypothetical protein